MENIIVVQDVSKSFGKKTVLDHTDLIVPRGCVFGLMGKNGAGKTTLIKSLLGLVKPTAGRIDLLGENPWTLSDRAKEHIGYTPQSDQLYSWLTVGQLLNYTASFYRNWNSKLVDKLLNDWDVDPQDRVGLLSEGQMQKVAIILALGHEPQLLIFDEPVASLDPMARRQFLKTILEIVSDRDCTIFFSSHITPDLERVTDQVAILNKGKVDFTGGLDVLKDTVKRLRIDAANTLPADLNIAGSLSCEINEHTAVVTVREFNNALVPDLTNRFQAKITVENLNLEEIFLELNA
jgi:ABC-2 type transport system ATP-binding protein